MKVIYKLILTCSTYTFSRPGVWVSPDNLLFLYRVMAELCSINKQHQHAANSSGSGSVNGVAGRVDFGKTWHPRTLKKAL